MKLKLLKMVLAIISLFAFSEAKSVKIGLITTLTSPAGYLGQDIRDGFLLAVEDGKLGGVKVDVIVGDDGRKPAVGKKLADKMMKKDKVDIFTGVVFSNVFGAVAPTVLKKKAFYVSPNAAPSAFAGKKCNANYFSVAWQNDSLHEAAGALANKIGYKKSVLIAPNYPAGIDSFKGYSRIFKGQKVAKILTKLGQKDYAVEISKIKSSGADSLFVFLPGGMGINFLKQYAAAGLTKKIPVITSFVNADVKLLKAVGNPMEGVQSASHWSHTMNMRSREFTKSFQDKYGRMPTVYASQGYETALLIGSALKATKGKVSRNSSAFRKALKKADFKSLREDFKFGNNNHPIQNWHGRIVTKDSNGKLYNKITSTILTNHTDIYNKQCNN